MNNHIQLSNKQSIYYIEHQAQFKNVKPTLLFIHGNLSSSDWWIEVIDLIKLADYHIIALDLRGFGKSTYKTQCLKLEHWARDVIEFCSLQSIKSIVVNGWSFGGVVSMKIAQLAPQLVNKVVLTSSVSHEGLASLKGIGESLEAYSKLPKVLFHLEAVKNNNYEVMRQIYDTVLFVESKNFPHKERLVKTAFEQVCYIETLYVLGNDSINIDNIKAPILMIHGKRDLVVPFEGVVSTGAKAKYFDIWEEGAHMIPIENTKKYVDSILKFLSQP